MTEKFIKGKEIRDYILDDLKEKFLKLESDRGIKARLSIFVVGDNNVTNSFIKRKKISAEKLGIEFSEYRYKENEITEKELIVNIKKISHLTDGIIVQLPLPKEFNSINVLNSIPVELDVDLLNEKSFSIFLQDGELNHIFPPVPGAIYEILRKYNFNFKDKNILLAGYGKLVGQPLAELFNNMDIKYDILRSKTENKEQLYKRADLIISGIGSPNLIKQDMIKNNVFLIDAGTSTSNQKVTGDIDLNCIDKASFFSKTPGGVGPITIAIIYKNLFHLIKRRNIL